MGNTIAPYPTTVLTYALVRTVPPQNIRTNALNRT
jgi:hypothetical protein